MGADQSRNQGGRRATRSGTHARQKKPDCWPRRAASRPSSRASLSRYRVLDPACGSGNFLPCRFAALKDFDLAVLDDAVAMGLPADNYQVSPEAVMGIEINGYAAELARLTVWITELQWQLRKGLGLTRRPILDKLNGIVQADALLTPAGKERGWPDADVIVGNPQFLGRPKLRQTFGDAYVERLFAAFVGRVPAEVDLVAYWFAKAWERMRDGRPDWWRRKPSGAVRAEKFWIASARPPRSSMPGQTSRGSWMEPLCASR